MTEKLSVLLERANVSIKELEEKVKSKDKLIATLYDEKIKLQTSVKDLEAKDAINRDAIKRARDMIERADNMITKFETANEQLNRDAAFFKSIIQTLQKVVNNGLD